MSSSILFVVIISALVAVSMANVGQRFIGHAVNDEYPGQCYYEEEAVPIKLGSTYQSKKECAEIQCQDEFVIRIIGCPGFGNVGQECVKTEDKTAVYPKCCPTFKCPQ